MNAPLGFAVSMVLLSLAIAAAFLVAVARVSRGSLVKATVGVVVWMAVPAALAAAGRLSFDTVPPTMLVLLAVLVTGTVVFARGELGGRIATGLPLQALIGYQGFRILVELWLHRGYEEGLFPVQMTYSGWNFDIVTGISAVAVGLLVARGVVGRRTVLAWNVVGLALLLVIVTIAILSAPLPLQAFRADPPNVYVTGFPGVWLPVVLVQAALLGHLLVFRRLGRGAGARGNR
jgi:hypothetical protein